MSAKQIFVRLSSAKCQLGTVGQLRDVLDSNFRCQTNDAYNLYEIIYYFIIPLNDLAFAIACYSFAIAILQLLEKVTAKLHSLLFPTLPILDHLRMMIPLASWRTLLPIGLQRTVSLKLRGVCINHNKLFSMSSFTLTTNVTRLLKMFQMTNCMSSGMATRTQHLMCIIDSGIVRSFFL